MPIQSLDTHTPNVTYAQYCAALRYLKNPRAVSALSMPSVLVSFLNAAKGAIEDMRAQFGFGKEVLLEALRQKRVFTILRAVRFNVKILTSSLKEFLKLAKNTQFRKEFKDLGRSGDLKRVTSSLSVSEILNKYSLLRHLTGLALAGFLLWVLFSFGVMPFNFPPDMIATFAVAAFAGTLSLDTLLNYHKGRTLTSFVASATFVGISIGWLGLGGLGLITVPLIMCLVMLAMGRVNTVKLQRENARKVEAMRKAIPLTKGLAP